MADLIQLFVLELVYTSLCNLHSVTTLYARSTLGTWLSKHDLIHGIQTTHEFNVHI